MAGGASTYQDDEGVITDINVTPLVDVVLVLLIVFMITMPTIVNQAVIPVDKPKSSAGEGADMARSSVTVTIKTDPFDKYLLFVDRDRVDLDGLRAKIEGMVRENPDILAIIAGERSGVDYGEIVKIYDVLYEAGVKRVGLGVER